MSLTGTGVEEIISRQHICSWLPSKEMKIKTKNKNDRKWYDFLLSSTKSCTCVPVCTWAWHGVPYLSARDARLFFVCYATHPFCAQNNCYTCRTCGARALSRHYITLKFSLVSFLLLLHFFRGGGGWRWAGDELWTKEPFLFCRYAHLTWTLPS